jgi:outer membrane protein OmpA-like peptidoglycan-associated protein
MRYLGLTLFIFMHLHIEAQSFRTLSQTKPGIRKDYEKAKLEAQKENTNASIILLLKCLEKDPILVEAWTLLGNAYHDIGEYKKSLDAFTKLSLIHPNHDIRTNYAFGLTAYKYGDYSLAVEKLTLYTTSNKIKGQPLEQASKLLENAIFARDAVQNPVLFTPTPLNSLINTDAPEYLPSFSADDKTLLFTRVVNGQEDIFYTQRDSLSGDWGKPIALTQLNTPFNEGAHTLSADGSTLIFTQCENKNGLGSCDLYISYKKGEQWTAPKNVGAPVNTMYWESMPSLSAAGDKLFFSSKRPGGFGGTDIWISRLVSADKWSVPENAGPNINTPGDDQAPFLHIDGQSLYFMSNGHKGMGGFDIYLSRKDSTQKWGKPIHLGYPINTIADEGALCINRTGETAYFSSSKRDTPGKGMTSKTNIDIFSFPLYPDIRPIPVTFVTGEIFANDSNQPLPAQLEISVTETEAIIFKAKIDSSGKFFICLPSGQNYSLSASYPGYTLYSNRFTLLDAHSALEPYYLTILLQKINKPATAISTEKMVEEGDPIVLKNVFFETGSAQLNPNSLHELNLLSQWLAENAAIYIQINGHTDHIGAEEMNVQLSTQRAKTVYEYLIQSGIGRERLRYKGYGSSKPVADNATEKGRKENRRTEFILLK